MQFRKDRLLMLIVITLCCQLITTLPVTPQEQRLHKENAPAVPFINDVMLNDDGGSEVQNHPAMAMNQYGVTVVCWEDMRNGNWDVYAQTISPIGIGIGSNFQVNDDGEAGSQSFPDVAINDQGHFVIVWDDSRNGSGDYDIYGRLYRATGQPIGPSFRINDDATTTSQFDARVAMSPNGDFVVCWEDRRSGSSWEVYAQRYDSTGVPLGSNILVNSVTTNTQDDCAIDMHADGSFVIAWNDGRNMGVDDIYARQFNADGTPAGDDFEVSTHSGQEASTSIPDVAIHHEGNFAVCWQYTPTGGNLKIYNRTYNSAGTPLTAPIIVNNTGSTAEHTHPAIHHNPLGGFGIVWDQSGASADNIHGRLLSRDGATVGAPFRINDDTGIQGFPDLTIDNRGFSYFTWTDNRNGNNDIYICGLGLVFPLNVIAGSGYDSMVPVSWDPPFYSPAVMDFKIYRSTTESGTFSEVASIDLTERGLLGSLMKDWIDTDVENGTTYYYKVSAVIGGTESFKSLAAGATPDAAGFEIHSGMCTAAPLIDGTMGVDEWSEAACIDIANTYAALPVYIYIMNDADYLYIAVKDLNDPFFEVGNRVYILFDEDHNGQWDAAAPSEEGLITLQGLLSTFMQYWGEYPNSLGANLPTALNSCQWEVSMDCGHVNYEFQIDLALSPISGSPGDTLGMSFGVADPGNFYPTHWGYTGEWPAGTIWETAATTGDVILAGATGVTAQENSSTPERFELSQNYPNPFNPVTTIRFSVPEPCHVTLKVLDVRGVEIITLTDRRYQIGQHRIHFDASHLSSGHYFYTVEMGDFKAVRKMTLLK